METITSEKTVKYVNKKLKKGKIICEKIRDYGNVNGKKVYSEYTAVKWAKI